MTEFKPNSHKAREEAKREATNPPARRVEPVVSGKIRKKSEMSKFKSAFIAEDAANVKSYIFSDVLLPAAKKMLEDVVVDGIHMLMYGESGRGGRRSAVDRISYDRYSRRPEPVSRRDDRRKSFLDYDDIVFDTRGEAEKVLAAMDEIMAEYGLVRVLDLYDLAGLSCDYPGTSYGWTNIQSASVIRAGRGFIIKMPRALPIN